MLFLMKHGEGPGEFRPEVAEEFRAAVTRYFAPQPTCKFAKSARVCGAASEAGTCFCEKHYSSARKDFVRGLFESYGMYIPHGTEILDDFVDLYDPTWIDFDSVMTKTNGDSALNTLSLIIQVATAPTAETSGDAPVFSLERVKAVLIDAGDVHVTNTDSSFNNVVEFSALLESRKHTMHNVSIKLWHNGQIHVCGCRDVDAAMRICSSVLRVLKKTGICHASARITSARPVFANASFDFFPHKLRLAVVRSQRFADGVRKELEGTDMTLELDASSHGETSTVIYKFVRPNGADKEKVDKIKIFKDGNVIITFNNFDSRMLQRALQALAITADAQKAFMRLSVDPIILAERNPEAFTFSPKGLVSSSAASSAAKRPRFE